MVNETKVRIKLTDAFSSGMDKINSSVNAFSNRLQKSGASMQGFSASMQGSATNVHNLENSLKSADAVFQRLIYSTARYLVIYQGLQGLGNAWDNIIGGAYRYGKMLETNTIGVAGILTSMTNLNGEQLKWNDALEISSSIMKKLQSEALRTAATSADLMEVFQAILGPGMASGMNVDEIVKLSTVGVNAVKSLGLPHNQLVQELRDLVQGGIRPASSTLATALGLKDADITAAKNSSEGLFKFLMRRLEGFDKSVGATSESVAGRLARIEEGLQVGLFKGGDELYKFYSSMLGGVADSLIKVKETTDETGRTFKSWEINPSLIKFSAKVSHDVTATLDSLKTIGSILSGPVAIGANVFGNYLSFAANNVGKLALAFAAYKGKTWISDILNVIGGKGLNGGSTVVGKMFNLAFYEPFTGAGKQLQSLVNYQQELNAYTQEYISIISQHNSIESALKSSATSVYNLAKYYEQLGIDAKTAGDMQRRAIENLKDMSPAKFEQYLAEQRNYAEALSLKAHQDQATKTAGDNILGAKARVMQEIAKAKAEYTNIISGTRSEDSILNLAKAYEKMGVSAEQAAQMQQRVINAVQGVSVPGHIFGENAEEVIAENEKYARGIQLAREKQAELKKLYSEQIGGVDQVIQKLKEENAWQKKIENTNSKVNGFLDDARTTKYNKEFLNQIIKSMDELNLSTERRMEFLNKYINATKGANKVQMEAVKNEMLAAMQRLTIGEKEIAQREELVQKSRQYASIDYRKLTRDQLEILEYDAQRIMNMATEQTQVEAITNGINALKRASQEDFITTEQYWKIRIDLLKQVVAGHVDVAAAIAKELELSYRQGELEKSYAGDIVAKKLAEAEAVARVVAMDSKDLQMQDRKILESEAIRKARLTADDEVIKSLKRIIENEGKLEEAMQERGLSSTKVSTEYLNFLKEIATADKVLLADMIQKIELEQKEAQARMGANNALAKAISKTASLSFATSILGETLISATNSENELANEVISGISAFAQITFAVDTFSHALEGMTAKAILAKASIIGMLVTAAAAVAYKAKSDYDNYTKGGKAMYDAETGQTWVEAPPSKSPEEIAKEAEERARKAEQNSMNLSLKFPSANVASGGKSGGSSANSAEKAAEKAKKKYEEQVRQINDLNAELAKKVLEQTGTTSEIELAKLSEELEKYKSKISKAENEGVDTKSAVAKLGEYQLLAEKKLKEKEIEDKHTLDMEYINTRQQLNVYSVDQAKAMRVEELNNYRTYLETLLADTTLNAEKRLSIEKKLAETIKEQEEQSATDYKSAWDNAMDHLKEKRYDLQATIESGMDNFTDTLTNFGQNMLTSTESFTTQIDNLFKDLANSIYNTMMKVFMQGLVNNMLGSLFGANSGIGTTKNVTKGMTIGGMKPSSVLGSSSGAAISFGACADGGYATGWNIVGERGPELVNFSQPGRVYNSEQTAKALSGGIDNVKVVIENKSGQQVKATQASTQFNAKEMVIGIVIDAVSRNDGGINNILKGAIA